MILLLVLLGLIIKDVRSLYQQQRASVASSLSIVHASHSEPDPLRCGCGLYPLPEIFLRTDWSLFTMRMTTTTIPIMASRLFLLLWFLLVGSTAATVTTTNEYHSVVHSVAFSPPTTCSRRRRLSTRIQQQRQPQVRLSNNRVAFSSFGPTTTSSWWRPYSSFSNRRRNPMLQATHDSSSSSSSSALALLDSDFDDMEHVVRQYFQGVTNKNATQIRSCFGTTATIRDVCALSSSLDPAAAKTVSAETLVERCLEFCQAHPDVVVDFYLPPTALRLQSKTTNKEEEQEEECYWVLAHWYERGTWSGTSCGIAPPSPPQPMYVEGQTRFGMVRKDDKDDNNEDSTPTWVIAKLIVTRTFTPWEQTLLSSSLSSASSL